MPAARRPPARYRIPDAAVVRTQEWPPAASASRTAKRGASLATAPTATLLPIVCELAEKKPESS